MRIVRVANRTCFGGPPIGVSIGGGISQVPIKGSVEGRRGTLPCDLSHDACDEPTLPLWTQTRL